jgi:hypothetical protein
VSSPFLSDPICGALIRIADSDLNPEFLLPFFKSRKYLLCRAYFLVCLV